MNRLLAFALTIAGAAALWAVIVWFAQRSMLFPAPPAGYADPTAVKRVGGSVQWLDLPFGRVESWWLPALDAAPAERARPLVIYAHGNGELIDFWPDEFATLRRAGLHVLLVEYPGYGRSEGTPSAASVKATMLAAYDRTAVDPRVDRNRVVAMGRSLGGGVAAQLASARPLAALVLESSFTSVADLARRFAVPAWLIRDRLDSAAVLRSFGKPVLVVHGRQDTIVPVAHGRQLAAIARGELHEFDCGHNDCAPQWELVLDFLRRNRVI